MSNNGTMSYVIAMLRQINQTTLTLSQNQNLLFEQFKSLGQKVDNNYIKLDEKINQLDKKFDGKVDQLDNKIDQLEKKFDNKIDQLEKKFDNKIDQLEKKFDNKIDQLEQTILSMQKEIKDMHEDITTIYTLETDSRKKLQKIM